MEQKDFHQYSDAEFRAALLATMNLKQEWMASVDKRERELGLRWDYKAFVQRANRIYRIPTKWVEK